MAERPPQAPLFGPRFLAPAWVRRALWRWLGNWRLTVLALALATLGDVLAGRHVGLLALPPILAALALSFRLTLLVSAGAVAASLVLALTDAHASARTLLAHQFVIVVVAVLACMITKIREEREQLLRRLALVARVAQEAIVRPPASALEGAKFAAHYVASADLATIGGDLYGVEESAFGVRFVIGDVRGNGLDAIETAATVLREFRGACHVQADLASLVRTVDERVRSLLDQEEFVTAVFGQVLPDSLELINCGHPAPLLVTSGATHLLEPTARSTPLGIEPSALVDRYQLEPGDRVLLYTDGLLARVPGQAPLIELADAALRLPRLEESLGCLVTCVMSDEQVATDEDMALLLMEREDLSLLCAQHHEDSCE